MKKTKVVKDVAEATGMETVDMPVAEVQQEDLQGLPTIMPIDDESNRLGEVIFTHAKGLIYESVKTDASDNQWITYFAWKTGHRRGYPYKSIDDAIAFLGALKPRGCADWEGTVRLGRMIERHGDAEIWKHCPTMFSDDYYVWMPGATEAIYEWSLTSARKLLGIEPKAAAK